MWAKWGQSQMSQVPRLGLYASGQVAQIPKACHCLTGVLNPIQAAYTQIESQFNKPGWLNGHIKFSLCQALTLEHKPTEDHCQCLYLVFLASKID